MTQGEQVKCWRKDNGSRTGGFSKGLMENLFGRFAQTLGLYMSMTVLAYAQLVLKIVRPVDQALRGGGGGVFSSAVTNTFAIHLFRVLVP